MQGNIHIKFWGVRGSTPCANQENMIYGGNTTCLQIDIPQSDELLIVDCGTGFRNLGNELNDNGKAQRGKIFLTHPHWDHLQGFPFFKPFYDTRNWFRVYIPPQGDIGCKEILQGHMSSTFFPVSIDMLEADLDCETFHQKMLKFEHFTVDYMLANHTIPTAIFKFIINGKSIIFAPDNELPMDESDKSIEFTNAFLNYIEDADILIHDAQFDDEQYEARKGWGHSSYEQVIRLAQRAEVPHLFLTHHDPDNSDSYLAELDKEISELYGKNFETICFVKEGQDITLT